MIARSGFAAFRRACCGDSRYHTPSSGIQMNPPSPKRRRLGTQGLQTFPIGLGCMGMSEFYGPSNEKESIATIHRALELSINMLDPADMYGPFKNEEWVGRANKGKRDSVIIATKFGNVRDPKNP